eukprot:3660718-Amphidinium_carterae.1
MRARACALANIDPCVAHCQNRSHVAWPRFLRQSLPGPRPRQKRMSTAFAHERITQLARERVDHMSHIMR